jgi:hypothetical protein
MPMAGGCEEACAAGVGACGAVALGAERVVPEASGCAFESRFESRFEFLLLTKS